MPLVKAQLLAFLIYTTPALLQQQLQGAGQGPEKAQEGPAEDQTSELGHKLPGPCPVLRRLITFDPGKALQLLLVKLPALKSTRNGLLITKCSTCATWPQSTQCCRCLLLAARTIPDVNPCLCTLARHLYVYLVTGHVEQQGIWGH